MIYYWKNCMQTLLSHQILTEIATSPIFFYYLFFIYIIIVLINGKKTPHHLLTHACLDILCVFKLCCSTLSRRLKASFHLLSHCCHASLWLTQVFQSDETSDNTGWKVYFCIYQHTLQSMWLHFNTLCCWTKISGVLWDTHTVHAPKTYHFALVAVLVQLK